jgi:hypothetical protein
MFLIAGLVVAVGAVLPSPSRAEQPTRSGTITAGVGGTQRGIGWPGQAVEGECQLVPDCQAWLWSGCDPALAGREPAVMASIVDVSALADGRTGRSIALGGVGWHWGNVLVQFWRETPDNSPYSWFGCDEIQGTRFVTGNTGVFGPRNWVIPETAKWMTVTTSFDETTVSWSVR